MIRTLKTIDLFQELSEIQLIYKTCRRLTAPFITMFASLYLIFYLYAQLGMYCFGGGIKILDLESAQPNLYYLMNFNDFGMSMITLFHLLVVNNWFVTCDMFVSTFSQDNQMYQILIRCFFISFWVVAFLIFFNLLISMIIEVYASAESSVDKETHRKSLNETLYRQNYQKSREELSQQVQDFAELAQIFLQEEKET